MSASLSSPTMIMLITPKTSYGGYNAGLMADISPDQLSAAAVAFAESQGTIFNTQDPGLRPFDRESINGTEQLGHYLNEVAGIRKIIKPITVGQENAASVMQAFLNASDIAQNPDVLHELDGLNVMSHVLPDWYFTPHLLQRSYSLLTADDHYLIASMSRFALVDNVVSLLTNSLNDKSVFDKLKYIVMFPDHVVDQLIRAGLRL